MNLTARQLPDIEQTRVARPTGRPAPFAKFARPEATSPIIGRGVGRRWDDAIPIQTRLAVGSRDDEFERDADHAADAAMGLPEAGYQRGCPCGGGCPRCLAERSWQPSGRLQPKLPEAGGDTDSEAPAIVQQVLSTPGQPLDPAERASMGRRFGRDFSAVRVHADARAAESAQAIHALAYTVGRDIVFGAGWYAPGTREGRRLIAHELVHVVQQAGRAGGRIVQRKSDPAEEIEVFGRLKQPRKTSGQCTDQEKAYVQDAFAEARRWVDWAILCVNSIIGGPFVFRKSP